MSIAGPSGTSIQYYTTGRGKNPKCVTILKCPENSNTSKKVSWECKICHKDLSSKRSYSEHMNVHNKKRPFQCDNCEYAAASQMTLHRHKLRNHTPKTEWGYRCPYCDEAYMEPAGYQQHVQHRHRGHSATYGCPFTFCKFFSKSQRHFREHLFKHESSDQSDGAMIPCTNFPSHQLVRYLINDECGYGYERKFKKVLVRSSQQTQQFPRTIRIAPRYQLANTTNGPKFIQIQQITPLRKIIKLNIPQQQQQGNSDYSNKHIEEEEDDEGPPILDKQIEKPKVYEEFRESEMEEEEIEEQMEEEEVPLFPNGFIEEELD
ncbi:unnamed protein product [Caenorhabditis angaria]|uniref:C2H2-type domain-containing protein n=1 Tax=Caenorhabditis angaria TaxID=860376 RepID=A0A9P1N5W8_9PELO|nr:unnamed protein product [Caenorhabditis angaria]